MKLPNVERTFQAGPQQTAVAAASANSAWSSVGFTTSAKSFGEGSAVAGRGSEMDGCEKR
jgi:hypothetical protein